MATSLQSFTLSIRGMTCASCSSTIENHLRQQAFVHRASVNLLTEQANVHIDTSKAGRRACYTTANCKSCSHAVLGFDCLLCLSLGIDEVITAIQDIGYEASILFESNDANALTSSSLLLPHEMDIHTHFRRFVVCCLFSIPAFVISMILPYTVVNESLMQRLGNSNLSVDALLLWCFATIVLLLFGRSFIIAAFKSLKQKRANMNVNKTGTHNEKRACVLCLFSIAPVRFVFCLRYVRSPLFAHVLTYSLAYMAGCVCVYRC
jgi:Cu+-exporting ATPase